MGVEEQIKDVEEEIQKTPVNKASEHHLGKLKAKLAKLKTDLTKQASSGKAQGLGYGLRKSGDATIIFVGFPSVGKSTLINALTNAKSPVAGYEFTTLTVIPGAMEYKGVKMQLLDVPGLVTGAASGKGRGKEVISVIRNADLVLLIADATKPEQVAQMRLELHDAGLRLDKSKPSIRIDKTMKGGIVLEKTNQVQFDKEMVKGVLGEFGILNANVFARGKLTTDDLIDSVEGNRKYVPSLVVMNKIDAVSEKPKIDGGYIPISALNKRGLDDLKQKIFEKLDFIRIYMKPQGGEPDFVEPLLIKKDSTVHAACTQIHKEFVRRFRYAVVSGPSAKFDNQKVGPQHVLKDKDILTIILEDE